jgi:hypothetical protein
MPRSELASQRASKALKAGEWVQVKSAEEILATLDHSQCVDGLPFMPEMLQYCGKTFQVSAAVHKTCDTIHDYVIRRMTNTVHLQELRCDGEAHGGCQAGCLLYWKDVWLRRVSDAKSSEWDAQVGQADWQRLDAGTRDTAAPQEAPRYRCQATTLLEATTEVRRRARWNPRFFIDDLTSGNVSPRRFVWYGLRAAVNSLLLQVLGFRLPRLRGLSGDATPTEEIGLQAGDLVHVRSKDEILQTVNSQLRNRGLSFDVEMVPYCGHGPFRVLKRVSRIIDEKTGRMITLRNPCVILDNVTCTGNHSQYRMFCRRRIYLYWREIWLKRAP